MLSKRLAGSRTCARMTKDKRPTRYALASGKGDDILLPLLPSTRAPHRGAFAPKSGLGLPQESPASASLQVPHFIRGESSRYFAFYNTASVRLRDHLASEHTHYCHVAASLHSSTKSTLQPPPLALWLHRALLHPAMYNLLTVAVSFDPTSTFEVK